MAHQDLHEVAGRGSVEGRRLADKGVERGRQRGRSGVLQVGLEQEIDEWVFARIDLW